MAIFRFLTSLTFAANAFALSVLLVLTLRAAYLHYAYANIGPMALMAVLVVILLAALRWVLSAKKVRGFLIRTNTLAKRAGLALAALLGIGVVFIAGGTLMRENPTTASAVVPFFLLYALLTVTTFILPGSAYWSLRAPRAPAPVPENAAPLPPVTTRREKPVKARAPTPVPWRDLTGYQRTGRIVLDAMAILIWLPGVYGFLHARFLPAPWLYDLVSGNPGVFFLLVCLPFAAALVLLRMGPLTQAGRSRLKPWLVTAVALPLMLGIHMATSFYAVQSGLPALLAGVTGGEPASRTVVVTEVGDRHDRHVCNRWVRVALPERPDYRWFVCRVPTEFWDEMAPGRELVVSGAETPFGLSYGRYALP